MWKQTDSTMKPKLPSTTMSPLSTKTKATATSTVKVEQTTELPTTTRKLLPPRTTATTTPKVLIETTSSPSTTRTTLKFMATTTAGHQQHEAHFNVVLPDTKIIETDDNEAEALPNIEIIPFVAHDAIDTETFEPYLKPYENLEKDYFANDKEKPFRYNNKFIHHSYDDSADYVYTNPHERIDNGPYYFESNDNQFDSFSPPSEQDFLGKKRNKEMLLKRKVSFSSFA